MSSDKDNFREDCDYKSCFARSMAVNSQYKLAKYLDHEKQKENLDIITDHNNDDNHEQTKMKKTIVPNSPLQQQDDDIAAQEVKLRKDFCQHEFTTNTMKNHHRSSTNSNHHHHLSGVPVQNIVQQSKVDTLQWQLRETEKSRAMYKELMKQVVVFLEKAHRNLEILSTKINNSNNKKIVSRSKSEHQILQEQDSINQSLNDEEDYTSFRDYTWRRLKKHEPEPDEIPPERLSQEAFRLLRTTQSLLSTQEPTLVQINNDTTDDVEFLNQLAKEFPSQPYTKPQRATSFSLSPKLIIPEYETRISTAFNRKLSLQLNETRQISKKTNDTCAGGNNVEKSPTLPLNDRLANSPRKCKNDVIDKASLSLLSSSSSSSSSSSCSGGGCSINSVEDESGFSSMNSFQEVGLPKIDNDLDYSLYHSYENDVKLWQKCDDTSQNNHHRHRQHHHKRWSSTPIDSSKIVTHNQNQSVKVLWV